MTRVVFVTSHPIQYQVPIFRLLAKEPDIEFTVLYAMLPNAAEQGAGFGVDFNWDLPLLEGYEYRVLHNVSANPGVTHFSGCDTPGIGDVLTSLRADAVIVNGWVVKTCLQALWACRRARIPCLVRGEANDLVRRPAWKRWLQAVLVNRYAVCLYIGSANKVFYEARDVPKNRLISAPYCIENGRFEKAAATLLHERESIRKKWDIEPDAVCMVFCGKFERKKHPLELMRAFAEAVRAQPSLHLLMVGDGELRSACEREAEKNRLPVTFAGFVNQSEIVASYVAADCLVLPSDAGETWGLVVNEAMACGLPAIVSDQVGCAADLVQPGETGEVFTFRDWSGLAAAMARLAGNPEHLAAMGEVARSRIQAYSPAANVSGIRAAVNRLHMSSVRSASRVVDS